MLVTTLPLAAICATLASLIGIAFKRSAGGPNGRGCER
jgi:hypothetical protein